MAARNPTDDAATASQTAQTSITARNPPSPSTPSTSQQQPEQQQPPLPAWLRDELLTSTDVFRQRELQMFNLYDTLAEIAPSFITFLRSRPRAPVEIPDGLPLGSEKARQFLVHMHLLQHLEKTLAEFLNSLDSADDSTLTDSERRLASRLRELSAI